MTDKRKGQVPGEIERIHSRIRHLGRKRKSWKYKGSNQEI